MVMMMVIDRLINDDRISYDDDDGDNNEGGFMKMMPRHKANEHDEGGQERGYGVVRYLTKEGEVGLVFCSHYGGGGENRHEANKK